MNIELSYDKEFTELIEQFRQEYPELLDIDGIGYQLDLNRFSTEFFSNGTTADTSIDANANVGSSSVITYGIEMKKPYEKINSYYMLWKRIKEHYDLDLANHIMIAQLTGLIYIHDVHGVGAGKPYCWNYSAYDLYMEGLPMVEKIKSLPPKHLYSFKSQMEQFITIAANSTLGATGIADMLIVMSYYVEQIFKTKKDAHFTFATDDDIKNYIKETLVSFIYTVNQPMRSGDQSPYTNVSIYDKYFLEDLQPMYMFRNGKTFNIEYVQLIQDLFLEVMNNELSRTPVTFPVTTACISVDNERNVRDEDFLHKMVEYNHDYGFINFFAGKSSTISACCFRGDQDVLVRDSVNGINRMPIKDYMGIPKENKSVYHDGCWVKMNDVETIRNTPMYKITTVNNKEVVVTGDHVFPTYDGDKKVENLINDDYLQFSTSVLDNNFKSTKGYSYNDGLLIGAYLGDGSAYVRSYNSVEITLSLNAEKVSKLLKHIPYKWHKNESKNNVVFLKSYEQKVYDFIKTYVGGERSYNKTLSMNVLDESKEFRQGIIDGYYITDGGNFNRIYSTSSELIKDIDVVFMSLGYVTNIAISDRTDEIGHIRDQAFKHNCPLYCIRWYKYNNKRSVKNIFKRHNGRIYFKIKSIEILNDEPNDVYCFEIKNKDEPYFTLPSGIITHNCRLRSDMLADEDTYGYTNSIGGSSTKVGSIGVCSINLPHIAFTSKDYAEFEDTVCTLVRLAAIINDVKRKCVQDKIDVGAHPLYTYNFIDIKKQYSTVGINGMYEAFEIMGYDMVTMVDKIIDLMDKINNINLEMDKMYEFHHNCEQVPGENMSVKMADKDKLQDINDRYDIYSNQFVPLTMDADIFDRILIQGKLDQHFSGGSILHLNLATRINNDKAYTLLSHSIKEGVIYQALNYVLNQCVKGHMTVGNGDTCSICGGEIMEKYTKVVGFLSNVKNWHKTRREIDFPNRKFEVL